MLLYNPEPSCTVNERTRGLGRVESENLQEHTCRVGSGREVVEEVRRSSGVAAGGRTGGFALKLVILALAEGLQQ